MELFGFRFVHVDLTSDVLKAKFHYASLFGACSELV